MIFGNRLIEKNINAGRFLAKIDDRPRVAPGTPSSALARSGGNKKEALVKRYCHADLLKYVRVEQSSLKLTFFSEHKEYEYYYYDDDDDDDDDEPDVGCEGGDCEYDYYDDEDGHGREGDEQYYEYYDETGDDSNKENKGDDYYYYYN